MPFIVADHVKETSVTTGGGPFTVAGAITGFSRFSARCDVGDTFFYSIQAVDGSGVPTAEWECGRGTYSAANTITRTTVTSSSNADSAVNFSAGTKHVFISMPAAQVRWGRERVEGSLTLQVDATNGDDSFPFGPFLTLQKAVDVACSLDMGDGYVSIYLQGGTYAGAILKPYIGKNPPQIHGHNMYPENVIINGNWAHGIEAIDCGVWMVEHLSIQTSGAGDCLNIAGAAAVKFGNLIFGECAWSHLDVSRKGRATITAGYAITGGTGRAHASVNTGGFLSIAGASVYLVGTPNFATGWVNSSRGAGIIEASVIGFDGTATGKRYDLAMNATCWTNNEGATYFPGNVAGTVATGAQYF